MRNIDVSQFLEKVEQPTIVGYTLRGETVDPTLYCCYAKSVKYPSDNIKFYVKADHKGDFFSPATGNKWGKEDAKRFDSERGKPVWDFIKVSREVFQKYLQFLKTGNDAHRTNAEREFRNRG